VQSVLRPALRGSHRLSRQKKNPLRNKKVMDKLNPYAAFVRKSEVAAQAARAAAKGAKKIAKGTRKSSELRKASQAKIRAIKADEFSRPQDA
jgi:hypothetical protein